MSDRYFLGGADLEMEAIRELVAAHAALPAHDKGLRWGARLSAYRDELAASLAAGETPVLVELADDLAADAFDRGRCVVVDHHGPRAGRDAPSALEQVFARLRLPPVCWTRRLALVAANDKGHIAGLAAAGAGGGDIEAVRTADRRAQGLTAADDARARAAVARRRRYGRLTVVENAPASAAADFLHPAFGGPGFDRLLVVEPATVTVDAEGAVVEALAAEVPGSWCGGFLPERGYWGAPRERVDPAALIERLRR